jgi:hypothetical protein
MKEYKFSKENARNHIRARLINRSPVILAAIIAGLFIGNYRTGGDMFENKIVLILTLVIGGIAVAAGIQLGIKRGAESLMYERFRLDETKIERLTSSGKIISIELNSIIEYKSLKSGLLLKSKGKKLIIPSELDNFDELSNLILKNLQ